MRGICIVLVASACGFSARAKSDGGGSAAIDAAIVDVALPDAPPGQVCFGSLAYDRVCFATANVPAGSHTYTGTVTIDTGMAATCNGNVHALTPLPGDPCIIAYDSITFTGAKLTIGGTAAVVFLATGSAGISVDGSSVIDVSSNGGRAGAGAVTSCAGSTAATQKGGGFGGSFLDLGGAGGLGAGDTQGAGGVAATVLGTPTALHGGCAGGLGGGNNVTGAPGGGAVALVAAHIAIDGLVAAGGDGGRASNADGAGGNGGGAGGLIVLDAPAITGSGELNAQGGGGGQGRGGNQPADGAPGYDPANRFGESYGGYTINSTGGAGGNGGPRIVNLAIVNSGGDGRDGTSTAGGGGGGGAAGAIVATSTLPGLLTVSPAPQ